MTKVIFDLDGHKISVLDGPFLEDGQPTAHAREYAALLVGKLDEVRAFAAREFLALYNDTWRDEEEDQPILDERGFCERLIEPSIVLYDELGSATIFFEDSNMFAGHSIMVSMEGETIRDATLVG